MLSYQANFYRHTVYYCVGISKLAKIEQNLPKLSVNVELSSEIVPDLHDLSQNQIQETSSTRQNILKPKVQVFDWIHAYFTRDNILDKIWWEFIVLWDVRMRKATCDQWFFWAQLCLFITAVSFSYQKHSLLWIYSRPSLYNDKSLSHRDYWRKWVKIDFKNVWNFCFCSAMSRSEREKEGSKPKFNLYLSFLKLQ